MATLQQVTVKRVFIERFTGFDQFENVHAVVAFWFSEMKVVKCSVWVGSGL